MNSLTEARGCDMQFAAAKVKEGSQLCVNGSSQTGSFETKTTFGGPVEAWPERNDAYVDM